MSRILLALFLLASTLASAQLTGVAVSPARTSVVGGDSQVFTARFFSGGQPAAGERVRFFNDACGYLGNGTSFVAETVTDATGTASMLFTALNTGAIHCTMSAAAVSGGGSVSFDVLTYRLSNVVVTATTDPVEPRPGQAFTIIATPRLGS